MQSQSSLNSIPPSSSPHSPAEVHTEEIPDEKNNLLEDREKPPVLRRNKSVTFENENSTKKSKGNLDLIQTQYL